jgi:hypothetical protein
MIAATPSPTFSWFDNVKDSTPSDSCTLPEWVGIARSDTHRKSIERIRAESDKDKRNKLKNSLLPVVSFSVEMDTRAGQVPPEARNYRHTGLYQIDVDLKDNPARPMDEIREVLKADPHVVMVATSPSGGIKAACRIPADVETHKAAAAAVIQYFAGVGIVIDKGTTDVPRLCFMTHDPEAWLRDGEGQEIAPLAPTIPPAAPQTDRRPQAADDSDFSLAETPEEVRALLAVIPPRPDDPMWKRISSAVRDAVGEAAAIPLLKEWSPEEKPGEYAKFFKSPLERVHAGTLVAIAKEHGFDARAAARAKRPAGVVKFSGSATPSNEPPVADPGMKFFYDGSRYYLDSGTQYIPMDQRSVMRHLALMQDPQAATTVCDIQTARFINFAGPLAGHPRGIHETNGCRILATSSPKIIQTRAGEWPTLQAVISGLLEDPDARQAQVKTFLGWLKIARQSLVSNRRRPGQALALAGPRGSGKSLLIDITEAALGGRRANPYPFFSGRTNFNGDLAGAELLAVDDDAGSSDIRARRHLAANIKSNLFAGAVRIEGKNKTAFTFRPCWRMMIAVNDEPEALLVLPPLSEDIIDKIILFRCHKRPLPMPAHTLDEKEKFFAQLMAEMPAMLEWLENWEIPEEIAEERCGVRFFHHPAIVAALRELSPEGQLLALIDTAAEGGALPLPWTGTAAELRTILTHAPQTSRDAEKLLGSWVPAAGTYLGRLEGDRVEGLPMLNGIARYRVFPSGAVE